MVTHSTPRIARGLLLYLRYFRSVWTFASSWASRFMLGEVWGCQETSFAWYQHWTCLSYSMFMLDFLLFSAEQLNICDIYLHLEPGR